MWKLLLAAAAAVVLVSGGPVEAKASRDPSDPIIVTGKRVKEIKQPSKGGKAGFRIEREARLTKDGKAALVRLEPGFQLALKGDLLGTRRLAVAEVLLPQPIPQEWARGLAPDRARPIPVVVEGRQQEVFLQPRVFRAVFIPRDGRPMRVFNAPVNTTSTGFNVLLNDAQSLGEGSLLIVSNNGKWLLTTQGQSVKAERIAGMKLKKGRVPDEFYTRYPSPLPPFIGYDRNTVEGQAFFAGLQQTFSDRALVYDSVYTGSQGWQQFLQEYTPLNSFGDRAISCTNMQLGGMDLATLGTSAALGLLGGLMNGVLSDNDCLAKRRGVRSPKEDKKS